MMATTADYLNKLITHKNTLADNLVSKGITATHDETLDTLIPKVLEISGGGSSEQLGVYPTGIDGRPTGDVTVINNVTTLSKYVFLENINVTTISLPDSIEQIDDYCFQKCTGLQNIKIPDKVDSIPQYSFDGCTNLKEVTLPKNLTNIGQYAFQNCKALTDITIPNDIQALLINSYAFSGCQLLDNDTISQLAQLAQGTIYNYAFANLIGITEVTTRYTCTNYFYGCSNLERVTILKPLNNGGFGQSVFNGCTNLTTVVLPNDATVIENNMFSGNTKLSTVNIPTSLISVGSRAFNNCSSLTEIIFPEGMTTISTAVFYGCTSLKTIYLPSSITTATSNCLTSTSSSYYAFYNCMALEDVKLGQDWNMSLKLDVSNNLTVESMVAMFNSLKDLTGETTSKTVTLGATNLAKLSGEQKLIAMNKNWTLA